MSVWLYICVISTVVSAILAALMLPRIIRVAYRKKLFDHHDERKIHKGIVPRLGGISFFPVIAFALCSVMGYCVVAGETVAVSGMDLSIRKIMYLLCGLLPLYYVGISDDLVGVRYRAKFGFQIVSALLVVISGVWVRSFCGLFWINDVNCVIGGAVALFMIIYIINAMNLIDGIDGLAGGLAIIGLTYYSILFYSCGMYLHAVVAGVAVGVLTPYFMHNVFGATERRSKVFMGDTGSLTIGLIIAFLSIELASVNAGALPGETNPAIAALTPVLIPCFDVVRVFMLRVRKGNNPFLPDKTHIHHKLLSLGMSQGGALVTILTVDILLIVTNITLCGRMQPTWILGLDILALTVLNMAVTAGQRRGMR